LVPRYPVQGRWWPNWPAYYSLAAQEFEEFGKDSAMLEKFAGAYPKLIYVNLAENDNQADIINLRSQCIGDLVYIQTDRHQPFPRDHVTINAVFRREREVRENADET
jgi:hypothetical protein